MATLRAAEHRDLEQRFRNLEAQVKQLTTKALRRPGYGVDQGDFVVSGGGDIVIKNEAGEPVWSALDGPVRVVVKKDQATNFIVPLSLTTRATTTFTVPEGYTQCTLLAQVVASARNSRATQQYLAGRERVGHRRGARPCRVHSSQ